MNRDTQRALYAGGTVLLVGLFTVALGATLGMCTGKGSNVRVRQHPLNYPVVSGKPGSLEVSTDAIRLGQHVWLDGAGILDKGELAFPENGGRALLGGNGTDFFTCRAAKEEKYVFFNEECHTVLEIRAQLDGGIMVRARQDAGVELIYMERTE